MRIEFHIDEFVFDGILDADSRDSSGRLGDQLEAELAEGGRRGRMLPSQKADPPHTPWIREVATRLSSVVSDAIRSRAESNVGGPD